MTSKEAREVLKASSIQQMSLCKVVVNGKAFNVKEALYMAIKSLEAWEKVKNDIYEIDWYGDDAFWDGVNLVSDIIDKHLSEVSE